MTDQELRAHPQSETIPPQLEAARAAELDEHIREFTIDHGRFLTWLRGLEEEEAAREAAIVQAEAERRAEIDRLGDAAGLNTGSVAGLLLGGSTRRVRISKSRRSKSKKLKKSKKSKKLKKSKRNRVKTRR
jgi:hypothetical protein